MVGQVRDGPRPQIGERADVEDGAPGGELAHEPGILLGTDAVPQPVGAERLERAANGSGAGNLARVRDRAEAERARECEDLRVRLGRELRLEPAEADRDDAAVAVTRRPLHGGARLLLSEPA